MDINKKENFKNQILETLLLYFKENQEADDHIDEIVKYCKMSKATFYAHFMTKENFIIDIMNYTGEVMLSEIDEITFNKGLAGKEKFTKKIGIIVNYWSLLVRFRSFLIRKLSYEDQGDILKERQKALCVLFDQYQIMLIELYGDEIKSYIWDMIFLLNAYTNIFIQIKSTRITRIDEEFMISLILSVLQALKDKLMITGGMLDRNRLYFGDENQSKINVFEKDSLKYIMCDIKDSIKTQELILERNKLLMAVERIEDEIKNGKQDSYITEAMLALLEKEPALQDGILNLKKHLILQG